MDGTSVVGAWKLISAKVDSVKGDTIYPYGENPFGMLISHTCEIWDNTHQSGEDKNGYYWLPYKAPHLVLTIPIYFYS